MFYAFLSRLAFTGMALLLFSTAGQRVHAQSLPTLTTEDYKKWEGLRTGTLSPDGVWFAYGVECVDGTYELHYLRHQDPPAQKRP